jgi:hypothetical protein
MIASLNLNRTNGGMNKSVRIHNMRITWLINTVKGNTYCFDITNMAVVVIVVA